MKSKAKNKKERANNNPPKLRGKRLTPEKLQLALDSEDWPALYGEHGLAQQKIGYMANSDRPDAVAREASATFTAQLTSGPLNRFLNVGSRVRKGGKKGAQLRRRDPVARKERDIARIVRYASHKRLGHKDEDIARLLGIGGRTLSRLKANYPELLKAELKKI